MSREIPEYLVEKAFTTWKLHQWGDQREAARAVLKAVMPEMRRCITDEIATRALSHRPDASRFPYEVAGYDAVVRIAHEVGERE